MGIWKKEIPREFTNRDWKEKDRGYLKELQGFLDKADNIQDIQLKTAIISQMLKCDKILTEMAEKRFAEFYERGYKQAKKA